MTTPLHKALLRYRGQIHATAALRSVVTAATAALLALSACAGAFAVFPWVLLPALWDGVILCWAASTAICLAYWFLIRTTGMLDVARAVESAGGVPHPLLSIALQLAGAARPQESAVLIEETMRRAAASLSSYPARITRPPSARAWGVLGVSIVAFLASLIPSPNIRTYWDAPLAFFSRQRMVVTPGTVRVARGAQVVLRMLPGTSAFPSCRLFLSSSDGMSRTSLLIRPSADGAFTHVLDTVRNSVVYQFTAGTRALPAETVTVVPPPTLSALSLRIEPPSYTGLKPYTLSDGQGNLSAFAGSRVHVAIAAPFPLARAWIIAGERDSAVMVTGKAGAEGTFTVRGATGYTFGLVDSLGQVNDPLPVFSVDLLQDEPPTVVFAFPGANRILRPEQVETLVVEAADDLGITRVGLMWRRSGEDSAAQRILAWSGGDRNVRTSLVWDLKPLSLYPQDTVYYWAYALDNKHSSPQRAVTDTFWLRLPGMDEIHRAVAQKNDDARDVMDNVRQGQKDLGEKLEELARSSQEGKELSWEQKKVVNDVKERIQSQQDSLRKAVEDLKEAVETMREQGMADEQLLKKMDEVRKAIEELVKNYGDSLLFKKDREPQELTPQELKDAVEKMKEALPQLEQQLDNALKYLEAMRKDQERAALADRTERLAQRQQEVAQMQDAQRQMAQEQALTREMDNLRRDIQEKSRPGTEEQLFDKNGMPALDAFDSLTKSMQAQCENRQMPSQQQMQQAAAGMLEMADQMRSQMSSAMMARMQKEQQKLLDMAHDALSMADWQNEISQSSESAQQQSADRVREQQALQQALRNGMSALDSLSMVPPQSLQEIVGQFDQASSAMDKALAGMPGPGPQGQMGAASAGLTGAAAALLKAGDAMGQQAMASGGAGGGMAGMMRKLSGKQAAINAATADLLRQMMQGGKGKGGQQGGEGESGESARGQARAAQNALADQLRQLAEKYGKDGNGSPGGGGRMKELEEEARKLAEMLQHPDQPLRERQDQFLSRMLQSTLSVHREEEGKEERKSTSAATVFAPAGNAPAGEIISTADTFYKMRRKALEGNIPPQYRGAVKAYFDSLGVLFLKGEEK